MAITTEINTHIRLVAIILRDILQRFPLQNCMDFTPPLLPFSPCLLPLTELRFGHCPLFFYQKIEKCTSLLSHQNVHFIHFFRYQDARTVRAEHHVTSYSASSAPGNVPPILYPEVASPARSPLRYQTAKYLHYTVNVRQTVVNHFPNE